MPMILGIPIVLEIITYPNGATMKTPWWTIGHALEAQVLFGSYLQNVEPSESMG